MNAIVVDDEHHARAYLERALSAQGVEVAAVGRTGAEALSLAESKQVDLLFLDIQMPDLTGLQAAAALARMKSPPLLVFVTGFSEHALQAFDYAAFDYLLKPVEPERLAITLTRAREHLGSMRENVDPANRRLAIGQRLTVRSDYAIKLVRCEDVQYALSRQKRVYLQTRAGEVKTNFSLLQLQGLLPETYFARIHASAIVRLDLIEELNFLGHHTYSATLRGGAVLPVGRAHYRGLQAKLGIDGREPGV